jgi:hypothetical protein
MLWFIGFLLAILFYIFTKNLGKTNRAILKRALFPVFVLMFLCLYFWALFSGSHFQSSGNRIFDILILIPWLIIPISLVAFGIHHFRPSKWSLVLIIVWALIATILLCLYSIIYLVAPRFQLGGSPGSDLLIPWLSPVLGLIFYFYNVNQFKKAKYKILYSVTYLPLLIVFLHLGLTASIDYSYNKKWFSGLNKQKEEECSNLFIKNNSPISELEAINESKTVVKYLKYKIEDWNFSCEVDKKYYEISVTPKSKNISEGELEIEIQKGTGKVTGIGVGQKSGLFYSEPNYAFKFCISLGEFIDRFTK